MSCHGLFRKCDWGCKMLALNKHPHIQIDVSLTLTHSNCCTRLCFRSCVAQVTSTRELCFRRSETNIQFLTLLGWYVLASLFMLCNNVWICVCFIRSTYVLRVHSCMSASRCSGPTDTKGPGWPYFTLTLVACQNSEKVFVAQLRTLIGFLCQGFECFTAQREPWSKLQMSH